MTKRSATEKPRPKGWRTRPLPPSALDSHLVELKQEFIASVVDYARIQLMIAEETATGPRWDALRAELGILISQLISLQVKAGLK